MKVAAIHNEVGGCGKEAFFLQELPYPGYCFESRKATLPDGSHPPHGTIIVCGSCLKEMHARPEFRVFEE